MPVQMHRYAVLERRKTPQNKDGSAPVALRFKPPRSASRSAASMHYRQFLNVSLWIHRRTSIVLLPHLGQRRWEMAQHCRTQKFFLSPSKRHGIVAASHPSCAFSVQAVLPNPSLNRTRYGMRCKPGAQRLRHCRAPGLHRLPPRAG